MILPLVDTLTAASQPPVVCPFDDGTSVVVLPHGGRVLGLFTGSSDENFFWTNPALGSVETARAFFASAEWHNSGGDRTWLAPEVDVFLPDYPRTDRYWQPRELDPGKYHVRERTIGADWSAGLQLTLSRSNEQIDVSISKSIAPAPNPLRHGPSNAAAGVSYAGYELKSTLFHRGSSGDSLLGIWNLLQMPHGGTLLVPAHTRATPRIYFGVIAPEDLTVSDQLVRYHMRAAGEHKIGLRAVALTGRAGYLYRCRDENWSLVVRNFFVNPSGEYVDVPWDDPTDLGYAVQACNVNSALGQFSELEYHVPALGRGTGSHLAVDVSQVWAYRGSWEQIAAVVSQLLTPESLPSLIEHDSHE